MPAASELTLSGSRSRIKNKIVLAAVPAEISGVSLIPFGHMPISERIIVAKGIQYSDWPGWSPTQTSGPI